MLSEIMMVTLLCRVCREWKTGETVFSRCHRLSLQKPAAVGQMQYSCYKIGAKKIYKNAIFFRFTCQVKSALLAAAHPRQTK
jgi:hypothetical protein